MFQRMDRDRDGIIMAAELPVVRNATNQPGAPNQPGAAPPNFDQNGDGKITELELETYFGDRRKELGFDDEDADRAATLIQRNDADGNRSLSRSELVASGADRNSPLSPEKLPVIDNDKDGKISMPELARYLKKTR